MLTPAMHTNIGSLPRMHREGRRPLPLPELILSCPVLPSYGRHRSQKDTLDSDAGVAREVHMQSSSQ
jgi:hypothetical protein